MNDKKKTKQDNPEQIPNRDGKTLIERENEMTVDAIPTEEVKIGLHDEKNKHKTKDSSSSENKHK
ncbi:hypothetical protein [Metabacillus idriensis]|uniref:hypothetical protein n=1 Tax=Metabacillus idriensis TaxID=324768 RepID=UPI0017498CE7|nr:hypothetical protein [Metabacillus idriensis]